MVESMELRSAKQKDYKSILINLGLYEDGMKLEEMQQVMQVLEESVLECETVFFENDLERALKESELDFDQMYCDKHSSTLIKPDHNRNCNAIRLLSQCSPNTPVTCIPNSDALPFDSPEIASEKIAVKAIVHHDLNYSPPQVELEFGKPLQLNFKFPSKKYNQDNNSLKKKMEEKNENSDVHIIKRTRLLTSPLEIDRNSVETHYQCDSDELGPISDDSHSDPSF
ncbi:PREDICTED: uncharacterized protein LOC108966620 isoform X2 [Bactrocera latifrons]|uniref:uncharacterized protein LOC108966620 isoform X2 n=1 Tax=Bactrocera latifrons TaxID=174628 RepID=UPI0008DD77D1|nr:PREDICTED: uncharacterized protein LOC108966620 isoform X2 [Bactrocera latifrons]